MGKIPNQSSQNQFAFTRLELAVVLAAVFLLGLVTVPLLGRSHTIGSEAVCMNNLRNLGRVMLIYCDQNRGYVPEEGNVGITVFNSVNTDAWYNLAVRPEYPSMSSLYLTYNFPVPGNGTIFSCPSATPPPAGQPSITWAFFMYAENNWLCVNKSTRTSTGASQTRLPTIPRPTATIFLTENNDNYADNASYPAASETHGKYAAAPHGGLNVSSMCDGSVRAFRTNEFNHDDSNPAYEWYVNKTDASAGLISRPCYWWPSPTTTQ